MSNSNHPFLEFPQIKPPFLVMGQKIKWNPNTIEIAPNCPRCFSSNTKFCYYNNYSVSQPRYFCKACRRYWTKGGSLRNVPIGGGCRKSRRGRSSVTHGSPPPAAAPVGTTGSGGDDVSATSAKDDEGINVVNVVKDYERGDQSSVNRVTIDGGDEKLHGCLDGRDFVYENFDDVFEVEGINDVVNETMFLSNLEGFGCEQPLMEMKEFEVFSSGENLMTDDNWGSFDLSAYDHF